MKLAAVVGLGVLVIASVADAQQVPDPTFRPPIEKPAFAPEQGPLVLLDEAHFNFHTVAGRYAPFADLLRRDGYNVKAGTARFTAESLKPARVLVIANALHESNRASWAPPNPSAFTPEEINAVREWIAGGGSLLLIADHAPFAGAATELGKALGIRFLDGYVRHKERMGPLVFRRSDGSLKEHPIARDVTEVATFTGSSFELDVPGQPLLVFGPDMYSFRPDDPSNTVPVTGRLQGAAIANGKGRIAVFGEAAMFSAQLAGPEKRPMGMNAPVAKENHRFLLGVVHWLTGLQ